MNNDALKISNLYDLNETIAAKDLKTVHIHGKYLQRLVILL